MRHVALTAATIMFFVLAGVGWAAGVPAWTCSIRCLAGSAAVYVLVRAAGNVAVRMIAEAATRNIDPGPTGNSSADRT